MAELMHNDVITNCEWRTGRTIRLYWSSLIIGVISKWYVPYISSPNHSSRIGLLWPTWSRLHRESVPFCTRWTAFNIWEKIHIWQQVSECQRNVVMRLVEPYIGKGTHVTSLSLADKFLAKKTTPVGTMNKVRWELPSSAQNKALAQPLYYNSVEDWQDNLRLPMQGKKERFGHECAVRLVHSMQFK